MAWNPPFDFEGDGDAVRVSASDVANTVECGRFLALKVRAKVKVIDGWTKLWPKRSDPFPLGDVVELLIESHGLEDKSFASVSAWLSRSLDTRNAHRLVRPYITHAVENVIDAHEAIEDEIGQLRLLVRDPHVGPRGRQLWVWGPLYTTDDGLREIRRFRVGAAHDVADEDDVRWVAVAARVAATYPAAIDATGVRVVELGPLDGSVSILFNGSPAEALELFTGPVRERTAALTDAHHAVPGRSCGDCKSAGSCTALLSIDGTFGQPAAGHRSRSISPTGLTSYKTCPARWLLHDSLHLPREEAGGEGMARGRYVHQWLETAHRRGVGCTATDLPEPGGQLGLAGECLDADEYAIAYPYLRHHVSACPLSADETWLVSTEDVIYGFDHAAQLVAVTKPDLIYGIGDRLVVREVKTALDVYVNGRDEAWNRHLQVPFTLALLSHGLAQRQGLPNSSVEIELLTPAGSDLWVWDNDDPVTRAVADGDLRRAAADWHVDGEWKTKPGPHCVWCPVRRWCPDRDVWELSSAGGSVPVGDASLDEPPF